MGEVRDDRQRVFLPRGAAGRRSPAVLIMLLLAVLAAIALMWNVSRHSTRRAVVPSLPGANDESVGNVEAPAPAPAAVAAIAPPATARELEPAAPPTTRSVSPVEETGGSARNRVEIARVIDDGRPGLTACYQRALVRDATLVRGAMTVHLSINPTGRVGGVNIKGPAEFRRMQPCLKEAISKWSFPTAEEPYSTEFALVFRGKE